MLNLRIILIILMFVLGFYYIIYNSNMINRINNRKENFENRLNYRCPNLLIQKDNDFYLYNSRLANVPGVNPIRFNNLEDYVEFIKWQKSQGIKCPILYLQQMYDAQGNPVYKQRKSPCDLMGGLNDYPANSLFYQPFESLPNKDYINQYDANQMLLIQEQNNILTSPIDGSESDSFDSIYTNNSNNIGGNSADAMSANWGGKDYTRKLVSEGYYDSDKVYIKK